jgi:hypothetical protein
MKGGTTVMPKPPDPPKKPLKFPTTEAFSYMSGIEKEYEEQLSRYHTLTGDLHALQARVELVEKNLCVTRDHLAMAIEKSEEDVPKEWRTRLARARFVGMRLADACLWLLKRHKRMTYVEILNFLNVGMFRFRTNAPAREIHGALLRQPYVKRTGDTWVWTGPDESAAPTQPSLRLLTNPEGTEKGEPEVQTTKKTE